MTRKRKKHTSNTRSKRTIKPQQATLGSARAALGAGQFREAIAGFKDLLKRDPQPDAETGLAEAYAGRAKQLSAKGMDKEALVMWENRARLGDMPIDVDHASLLLRLGRIQDAIDIYRAPDNRLDAGSLKLLGAHLAARYLACDPALEQVLADDDPILVHGSTARQALDAYCSGDDAAVAAALGAIPFRSPYRDLVQIIKGLQRLTDAPEEAKRLLTRIGDDSAFANLRRAAELALIPEDQLSSSPRDLGPATRKLVFALRGWSAERQTLWLELQKLGASPSPKQLLALMHRHRKALGDEWVRQRGLRLLLSGDSYHGHLLTEMHLKPLTQLERIHLAALDAEAEHDPWNMTSAWEDYVHTLEREHKTEPGSDQAIRIALMLRRTDQVLNILGRSGDVSDLDELPEETLRVLEDSLTYDPDDRQTYLRLITYFRQSNELKNARRILAQAQKRWPEDKLVLTAAMETALTSGAYKKAATIARGILKVDPINSGVRETLIEAHLSHARKHLRGLRPDLAAKSLDEAAEWIRSERSRALLELNRGFVKLAVNSADGEAHLKQFADRHGNGLNARLMMLLEAERSRLPVRSLLRRLGLLKAPKVEAPDLLAFFASLREELDTGAKLTTDIKGYFSTPLKSTARLKLDKGQLESACETLRRAGLHDARLAVASSALKRWPRAPLFELHAAEATYEVRGLKGITSKMLSQLEAALVRAQDEGDMRLVHGLKEFLKRFSMPFGMPFGAPPRMPFDFDFFDDDDDDEDDDEDEDDDLFNSPLDLLESIIHALGPDALLDMLKEKNPIGDALRDLQRTLGKRQLQALIESIAQDMDDDGPHLPDLF